MSLVVVVYYKRLQASAKGKVDMHVWAIYYVCYIWCCCSICQYYKGPTMWQTHQFPNLKKSDNENPTLCLGRDEFYILISGMFTMTSFGTFHSYKRVDLFMHASLGLGIGDTIAQLGISINPPWDHRKNIGGHNWEGSKGCPKPSLNMSCHVHIHALLSWPLKEILKKKSQSRSFTIPTSCSPPHCWHPKEPWKNGWEAHHHIPI